MCLFVLFVRHWNLFWLFVSFLFLEMNINHYSSSLSRGPWMTNVFNIWMEWTSFASFLLTIPLCNQSDMMNPISALLTCLWQCFKYRFQIDGTLLTIWNCERNKRFLTFESIESLLFIQTPISSNCLTLWNHNYAPSNLCCFSYYRACAINYQVLFSCLFFWLALWYRLLVIVIIYVIDVCSSYFNLRLWLCNVGKTRF